MPRRARGTQAPQSAPGQAYGEGVDQIQAQKVIPLPDRNEAPAPAPAVPGQPTPAGGDPGFAAALAAAASMAPADASSLARPTGRPDEPITAGLPIGAGPGPTTGPSRAKASSVADTYMMLAQVTGNPLYRALAAAAADQGV